MVYQGSLESPARCVALHLIQLTGIVLCVQWPFWNRFIFTKLQSAFIVYRDCAFSFASEWGWRRRHWAVGALQRGVGRWSTGRAPDHLVLLVVNSSFGESDQLAVTRQLVIRDSQCDPRRVEAVKLLLFYVMATGMMVQHCDQFDLFHFAFLRETGDFLPSPHTIANLKQIYFFQITERPHCSLSLCFDFLVCFRFHSVVNSIWTAPHLSLGLPSSRMSTIIWPDRQHHHLRWHRPHRHPLSGLITTSTSNWLSSCCWSDSRPLCLCTLSSPTASSSMKCFFCDRREKEGKRRETKNVRRQISGGQIDLNQWLTSTVQLPAGDGLAEDVDVIGFEKLETANMIRDRLTLLNAECRMSWWKVKEMTFGHWILVDALWLCH